MEGEGEPKPEALLLAPPSLLPAPLSSALRARSAPVFDCVGERVCFEMGGARRNGSRTRVSFLFFFFFFFFLRPLSLSLRKEKNV